MDILNLQWISCWSNRDFIFFFFFPTVPRIRISQKSYFY